MCRAGLSNGEQDLLSRVHECRRDQAHNARLVEYGDDPACGSGHFLLGGFRLLFDRWCKIEPGTNRRELVQRGLNSVHGVDRRSFLMMTDDFPFYNINDVFGNIRCTICNPFEVARNGHDTQ